MVQGKLWKSNVVCVLKKCQSQAFQVGTDVRQNDDVRKRVGLVKGVGRKIVLTRACSLELDKSHIYQRIHINGKTTRHMSRWKINCSQMTVCLKRFSVSICAGIYIKSEGVNLAGNLCT